MTQNLPSVLEGIKVAEFAQNAAIPHCGRLLAGLGADVVKIEPPGGDAMRALAVVNDKESRGYALINPGKRSVAIDLGAPDARTVVDALLGWADIALTAFKLPDLERYGLDWQRVQGVNPRLIHLVHTAFGPEGPDAHVGGYDVLAQGRSGVGFIMNRSNGDVPRPTRPAVNDFGSGFSAAFAVMAALRHRDQTGEGQRIDTSLLGTAMSLGTPLLGSFSMDVERIGELDDDIATVRAAGYDFDAQRQLYESRVQAAGGAFHLYFRHYRTADGFISVAGLSSGLFAKFHAVTGVPVPTERDHLHPSFQEAIAQANDTLASRTTAEWVRAFREVGYPCGPYNMPHQALQDAQVLENKYVVDVDHPDLGTYTTTGMPFRMEKSRAEVRSASPQFAAHTSDVLAEIGLDHELVASLLSSGAVIQA